MLCISNRTSIMTVDQLVLLSFLSLPLAVQNATKEEEKKRGSMLGHRSAIGPSEGTTPTDTLGERYRWQL